MKHYTKKNPSKKYTRFRKRKRKFIGGARGFWGKLLWGDDETSNSEPNSEKVLDTSSSTSSTSTSASSPTSSGTPLHKKKIPIEKIKNSLAVLEKTNNTIEDTCSELTEATDELKSANHSIELIIDSLKNNPEFTEVVSLLSQTNTNLTSLINNELKNIQQCNNQNNNKSDTANLKNVVSGLETVMTTLRATFTNLCKQGVNHPGCRTAVHIATRPITKEPSSKEVTNVESNSNQGSLSKGGRSRRRRKKTHKKK